MKTKEDSQAVTAEQLISLLEFETARLQHEEARPGWSKWALFGALGAVLWLLVSEFDNPPTNWHTVALLFLLLSLALDLIDAVASTLGESNKEDGGKPRFLIPRGRYGRQRPLALFVLVRSLLLLAILRWLASILPLYSVYAGYLYTGLIIFAAVGMFFISFLSIPLPAPDAYPKSSATPKVARLLWLLMYLADFITIFGLSQVLLTSVPIEVAAIRTASLLVATLLLLRLLARDNAPSPLLATLSKIRRRLALGELDSTTAKNQIQIAFAGLKASDVLQDDLSVLLALLTRIEEANAAIRREIELLPRTSGDAQENAAGADRRLVGAILRSVGVQENEARTAIMDFERQLGRLKRRSRYVTRTVPTAAEEVNSLIEKLERGFQASKAHSEENGRVLADVRMGLDEGNRLS